MPYFPSRQCYLATDPRSRNRLSNQPLTVQSCCHHRWTILDTSFQGSNRSTFLSFSGHQICWQPVHFVSGRQETWSCHSSSFTGWFLSTSRWIGGSHHQWTVGFRCWFQTSERWHTNSQNHGKFEILHPQGVFALDSQVYSQDAILFPAILIRVRKVQVKFTHWFYFMEPKASQSQTATEPFEKSKKDL